MARNIYEHEVPTIEAPVDPSTMVARVVNLILSIITALLALRFVFTLLDISTAAPFASAIYALTDPLIAPFRGMLPATTFDQFTIDWTALLAMLIYALLASIIVSIFRTISRTTVA